MKALNKLFIAAMAAATMTACSNELTEQQTSSNGIINFKMGIGTPAPSRTAMADDGYSATFEAGDQVGIFVKDMDSYTNLLYSTEDGNNWTGNPIKAPAEGGFSYTFYAYYPYSASVTDASNITTTVATNQNTEGFIENDFLVSTATTSNETVNLPFDHALSLVEVRLEGSNAADDATVSILNVATDATIDLTAETAETAPTVTTGNTKANVAMDALEGTPKYRAIIPAQDITANTALFEINSNGRKYTASYKNDIKFEQGKYLAMIITLGEAEEGGEGDATIEIVPGATINDWEEGTGGEGGEVVETPDYTTLLDLSSLINSDMSFTQKANWSTNKLTDESDYWFTRTSATTTVSYDNTETAIKAENTTDRGAWGTTSFGYHCGSKVFERTTYRLTFDAKSTIKGNQVFAVGVRNSDDSKSFRISNLNSGKRNQIAVNFSETEVQSYKSVTVDIDFTQASATTNLNDQESFETTTETDLNGITIYFFNNLNGASTNYTTYFKNIKFEKVVE